jgi:hypothetical protein
VKRSAHVFVIGFGKPLIFGGKEQQVGAILVGRTFGAGSKLGSKN